MYTQGLGFEVLGRFVNHAGFDGVMLGDPGGSYHLEFTFAPQHPIAPTPTVEDLLVFYLPSEMGWETACARMLAAGFRHVPSFNPYWDARGRTYEDPDGYRTVFKNAAWRQEAASEEFQIRPARPEEAGRLREIEDLAGTVFSGLGLIDEALDPSFPMEELSHLIRIGQAWVACTTDDVPVGMVLASVRDGAVYIEEMDVVPSHGRRGLGTRMLAFVCAWANSQGYAAVTLATFRDLPWNGPFYRKRGFRELLPSEWTPSMRGIREREARHGLQVDARVFMRCDLRR